eukprot:jgi/Botrbrau1/17803/Bobra.0127s0052.1
MAWWPQGTMCSSLLEMENDRPATQAVDAALHASGRIPTAVDTARMRLEAEADRRCLLKNLKASKEEEETQCPGVSGSTAVEEPQLKKGPPQESSGSRPRSQEGPSSRVVLATYSLDFGIVVAGMQKVRKFRIFNASLQSLPFSLETALGDTPGFSFSTHKGQLAAWSPSGFSTSPSVPSYMDVSATFLAGSLGPKNGVVTAVMHVLGKGGPQLDVRLSAHVVTPELRVFPDALSFPSVPVGCCKVMFLRLHNPREAPAEWTLKKPMDAGADKDWTYFTFSSTQGTLVPRTSQLLKVTFMPASHPQGYAQRVIFKVANTKITPAVVMTGSSFMPKILIEPQHLDLGAVMPDQAPLRGCFTISNVSEYPVEVMSLDFDEQYLRDEEQLRNFTGYDDNDTVLVDPIPPGICHHLALPPQEVMGRNSPSQEPAAGEKVDLVQAPTTTGAQELSQRLLMILLGPDLAETQCVAQALGKRYSLPIVSYDSLLGMNMEGKERDASAGSPIPETPLVPFKASEEQTTLASPIQEPNSNERLLAALRKGVSVDAFPRGFILNGLGSVYASPKTVMRTSLEAMGLRPIIPKSDIPDIPVVQQGSSKSPTKKLPGKTPQGQPPPPPTQVEAIPEEWAGDCRVFVVALKKGPADHLVEQDADSNQEVDCNKTRRSTPQGTQRRPMSDKGSSGTRRSKPSIAAPPEQKGPAKPLLQETACVSGSTSAEGGLEGKVTLPSGAMPTDIQPGGPGAIMKGNADSCTGEQLADAREPRPVEGDFEKDWESHLQSVEELKRAVGGKAVTTNRVVVRDAPCNALSTEAHLIQQVCGITFDKGEVHSVLPSVPADKELVPDSYLLKVLRRPKVRAERKAFVGFSLAADLEDAQKTPNSDTPPFRWVLPANTDVKLNVDFHSGVTGVFKSSLAFEVLGFDKQAVVNVTAECGYPTICSDPTAVFAVPKARPQYSARPLAKSPRKSSRPTSAVSSCVRSLKGATHSRISMARGDKHIASTSGVTADGCFDFGSLLKGLDRNAPKESIPAGHSTSVRILNTGRLPAMVALELGSRQSSTPAPVPTPSKGKAGAAAATKVVPQLPPPVFALDTQTVEVAPGEFKLLTLNAYPPSCGVYEDVLTCRVAGNPVPVCFPIACTGARPLAYLHLTGDTPPENLPKGDSEPPVPVESKPPAQLPGKTGKSGAGQNSVPPPSPFISETISKTGLDLGRLLIGRGTSKTVQLRNCSPLTIAWRAAAPESIHPSLVLSPQSGQIRADQDSSITATFTASEEGSIKQNIVIEIMDLGSSQGVAQELRFDIAVEAYTIDVQTRYSKPGEAGLNFGTLQGVDEARQQFSLVNGGQYPVNFKAYFRKQALQSLFKIIPGNGNINSGCHQALDVLFNSERSLKQDLVLPGRSDLVIEISDPATDIVETRIPVALTLKAVFSKFSIQPSREINFGPTIAGTSAGSKKIQVANLGEFPFTLRVSNPDLTTESVPANPHPPAVSAKGSSANKTGKTGGQQPSPPASTLVVGAFTISPCLVSVQPGESVCLAVTFQASGSQCYKSQLAIDISGSPPGGNKDVQHYDLLGESCIPSLDGERPDLIFEEHKILEHNDSKFGLGNMSTMLCELPYFIASEKRFCFGPVLANVQSTVSTGEVRSARLRLPNPGKVPADIKVSLRGLSKDNASPLPWRVEPEQVVIPPHDSCYITVYFEPTALQVYAAILDAMVEGNKKGLAFTCELSGEGVLPSLSVEVPASKGQSEPKQIVFSRTLVGRLSHSELLVKNDGGIPASAVIAMPAYGGFSFEGNTRQIQIKPHHSHRVTFCFAPVEAKSHQHEVTITVLGNPFEKTTVQLKGDSYSQAILVHGFTGEKEDELRLPDTAPSLPTCQHLTLENTTNKCFRFEWPAMPNLTFAPAAGHLFPNANMDVLVKYLVDTPSRLDKVSGNLVVVEVTFPEGTMTSSPWMAERVAPSSVAVPITTKAKSASAKGDADKQGPPLACPSEPICTPISDSRKEIAFRVRANAEYAKIQCDTTPIVFAPTFMYQSRSFTFPMKNAASTLLKYLWQIKTTAGDPDPSGPYKIQEASGILQAGESRDLTLLFMPTEVEDCSRLLVADVQCMDPGIVGPSRSIVGSVLRPWCHFELTPSNYLTSGRRTALLTEINPLPSLDTQVLEFEAVGVKTCCTQRFCVRNPTSIPQKFLWSPQRKVSTESPFTCLTPTGNIPAGGRVEMLFQCTPSSPSVQEALWTFHLLERSIHVNLLLVVHVLEPRVSFDMAKIDFGQLRIGSSSQRIMKLQNSEAAPFHFELDRNSLGDLGNSDTGQKATLAVSPTSGTIPPHSGQAVHLTFAPESDGPINCNLIFKIRGKSEPLPINVKGGGSAIRARLEAELGGRALELSHTAINDVDFGQILAGASVTNIITVVNAGGASFDFCFGLRGSKSLAVSPAAAMVRPGERIRVELTYGPAKQGNLDTRICCQITQGPLYTLRAIGTIRKPAVELSFSTHDFGPRFITEPGVEPATTSLKMTNKDSQELPIDVLYENCQSLQFEGDLKPLAALETREFIIKFSPQEARRYLEHLPIRVGSSSNPLQVVLKGEGVPLQVEAMNGGPNATHFGVVSCGAESTLTIKVQNRSKAPATISFSRSKDVLAAHGITVIEPRTAVNIQPRQVLPVVLSYRPLLRCPPFHVDVAADVAGACRTLFTVSGVCSGAELRLTADSIPFGVVLLGSQTTHAIRLENVGDIRTAFRWDVSALGPHFSIVPSAGIVLPGQDLRLEVTFKPVAETQEIRLEKATCTIEGGHGRESHPPLFLTLTGCCTKAAPHPTVLQFLTPVRSSVSKTITLHNPTPQVWRIKPLMQNKNFAGPELFEVPAASDASCAITYSPLTMTPQDAPEEGSAFFPTPDGSGILYELLGTAGAPSAAGTLSRTVTAKLAEAINLVVCNPLSVTQRFNLHVELKEGATSTQLTGPHYIDVGARSEQQVELRFVAHVEGCTTATVTFKNEVNGEYMFYNLTLTAGPAAIQGEIKLNAPVRSLIKQQILLQNPLPTAVTLESACENRQIQVPQNITLSPLSQVQMDVAFRPLLVGASTSQLQLTSSELGTYIYNLQLNGLSPPPAAPVSFTASLGTAQTQVYRFTHWLPDKAKYTCTFESKGASVFSTSKEINAPAAGMTGTTVEVDIKFEPSSISNALRDVMTLTSQTGGEYTIPLLGRCTPPKPLGPFELIKGNGVIPFRNIFPKSMEFFYSVDNSAFTVKPKETIPSKKSIDISVAFKGDSGKPIVGRLTVACPSEDCPPWVFYLKAS